MTNTTPPPPLTREEIAHLRTWAGHKLMPAAISKRLYRAFAAAERDAAAHERGHAIQRYCDHPGRGY